MAGMVLRREPQIRASGFNVPAGTLLTLLYDGHGSTRALLDAAAAIIQAYAYEAYGTHLTGAGLVAAANALTTLLYSGEHFDAKTQIQYLRARWYDPSVGRFNRVDPFAGSRRQPQSLHRYSYGHQNPVLHSDPSGRIAPLLAAILIGAVFSMLFTGLGMLYNTVFHGASYSYADVAKAYGKALLLGGIGGAAGFFAAGAIGAIGAAFTRTVAVQFGTGAANQVAQALIRYGGKTATGAAAGAAASAAVQLTEDIKALFDGTLTFSDAAGRLRGAAFKGAVTGGILAGVTAPIPVRGTPTAGDLKLAQSLDKQYLVPLKFSDTTLVSTTGSTVNQVAEEFLGQIIDDALDYFGY